MGNKPAPARKPCPYCGVSVEVSRDESVTSFDATLAKTMNDHYAKCAEYSA